MQQPTADCRAVVGRARRDYRWHQWFSRASAIGRCRPLCTEPNYAQFETRPLPKRGLGPTRLRIVSAPTPRRVGASGALFASDCWNRVSARAVGTQPTSPNYGEVQRDLTSQQSNQHTARALPGMSTLCIVRSCAKGPGAVCLLPGKILSEADIAFRAEDGPFRRKTSLP